MKKKKIEQVKKRMESWGLHKIDLTLPGLHIGKFGRLYMPPIRCK